MKKTALICLTLLVIACGSPTTVKKEDIKLLNGYWEINKVFFADGTSKEYKANPVIDFFEINNLKGFRTKVKPKIGGTFIANNDIDKVTITQKQSTFTILYSNSLTEREEELINLTKDSFTVKDTEQITYVYKRYQPIQIEQ
ncbi:hypothetical protein [Cellulophaga omnivescoria]|uniref:hypothetical protein n=1 Tax=Cellulophaga omnivescoria TaxID=1888890 RepID=UPI0009869EDD|nr:hypothetical protein [Cellulophaga omnivescoria]WBU89670.1 hypothetical protein PBN93_01295 [Cellulophaga omnivescoria]WKB81694.1 hypothetical protein QYR09_01300 [Cellulophaga lytica]